MTRRADTNSSSTATPQGSIDMNNIHRKFRQFLRQSRAVSALEYAILVGVIAVGVAAALATFNDSITAALTTISADLTNSVNAL